MEQDYEIKFQEGYIEFYQKDGKFFTQSCVYDPDLIELIKRKHQEGTLTFQELSKIFGEDVLKTLYGS